MPNFNRSKINLVWRLAIVIALSLFIPQSVSAQAPVTGSQYFPDSGHNVEEPFLTFFEQNGGLRVFGYPVTEQFSYNGLQVQYFQNARMEFHPENPVGYQVELGLLGDELGHGTPRLPSTGSGQSYRYFPETGHTVAFAFLDFFDRNGGIVVFGYPIDEFKIENGRYVQYFQRAKMEWHPELSRDNRIQLGALGSLHFDVAHLPVQLKAPAAAKLDGTIHYPDMRLTASVAHAAIKPGDQQTLFVFVADSQHQPVSGARIYYAVHENLATQPMTVIGTTNAEGFISVTFTVNASSTENQEVLDIKGTFGEMTATTQTSFTLWY